MNRKIFGFALVMLFTLLIGSCGGSSSGGTPAAADCSWNDSNWNECNWQ